MQAKIPRDIWLACAAFVVCAIPTVAPLFVARDVPLIDLPSHLAVVDVWNRFGDGQLGYAQYYQLHIQPAPYWMFYGFLHFASYVMPLRWAAKLFIAFTLLSLPLGLFAWIKQHRGPTVLALAAFPLAWNMNITWGSLAYAAGLGALFYSYALLARLDDARPWASRGLWAANFAVGIAFAFVHPLIVLLWLIGVLVYARKRALLLAAPALLVFARCLHQNKPADKSALRIEGVWRSLSDTASAFYEGSVLGPLQEHWRAWIFGGLGAALVLAILCGTPRVSLRDRRPILIVALLALAAFGLPLSLGRPMAFAGMNTRVAVVLILALFGLLAGRDLRGWRAGAVAAPLLALGIAYPSTIAARTAEFGAREHDFYTLVEQLPYDPKVLTLVFTAHDASLGFNAWRKFGAYVQLERGGYDPLLWDEAEGIGAIGFPVGYWPGHGRPTPPFDQPDHLKWDREAIAYDFLLTQDEPKKFFNGHGEWTLIAEAGAWHLWKHLGGAQPVPPASSQPAASQPSSGPPTSAPVRAAGH